MLASASRTEKLRSLGLAMQFKLRRDMYTTSGHESLSSGRVALLMMVEIGTAMPGHKYPALHSRIMGAGNAGAPGNLLVLLIETDAANRTLF
jgi:hypothetical protein